MVVLYAHFVLLANLNLVDNTTSRGGYFKHIF